MPTMRLKDLGAATQFIKQSGTYASYLLERGTLTKVLTDKQQELAKSMLATAAAEGTAAGSTNTLGLAFKGLWATIAAHPLVAVIAALGAATVAVVQCHKKMQKAREETIDQGKATKAEIENIQKLKLEYDEANASFDGSTESKAKLESATNALLDALGLERLEVEKLGTAYDNLNKKIDTATIDTLKMKQRGLIDAQVAAEDHFKNLFNYPTNGINLDLDDSTTATIMSRLLGDKRFSQLAYNPINSIFGDSFNLKGGAAVGSERTYENYVDALENAEALLELIEEHSTGITDRDLHATTLWKSLNDFINQVKPEIEAIRNARDDVAESIVSIDFFEGLQSGTYQIPKTVDEYYNLRDALIETAEANEKFTDAQGKSADAVDKLLSGYSFSKEFASGFNEFEHNLKDAAGGWHDLLISKAKDTSVDIKAYIQDIFNDSEMFGDQGLDDWARKYNYTIDDIVAHLKSMREEIEQPIIETEQSNAALDAFRRKLKSLRADVVRSIGFGLELSKDQTEEYYRWLDAMGYLDGETAEVQAKAAQLKAEFRQFFASDPPWNITDQAIASRLEQAVVNFQNIRDGIETGKFGNIDVFDREANFRIVWDEDNNLERFKSELDQMGIKAEELKGKYDTLFGNWDTFEGIDIAFTPILNVKNDDGSKEAILLSPETVNKYIAEVLKEARNRGNGELTADLILKVDSEGIEGIDNVGRRLNGLIAAVGDTAEITSMLMHDVAVDADNTSAALLMAGEYLEYAMDSAMGYIRNVIGAQLADLASLRDELQLTAKAWEEYQEITSAGDPSDWANKFEEAYSKAMTDIDNGRIDTPAVWGAAKLLFSDEQLADMGWDLQVAAQQLRRSFFTELFSDPDDMEDADKLDIGAKFLNWLNKNKGSLKNAQFDVDASGMFSFTYDSEEAFAKELGISTEALTTLLKALDAFGVESMRSKEAQDELVNSFERMFNIVNATADAVDGNLSDALTEAFDGLTDEEINQKVDEIKASIQKFGDLQTVLNEFAYGLRSGGMQENHVMDTLQSMKDDIEAITGTKLSADDSEFKAAIAYANEEVNKLDQEKPTPTVDLDTSEGEAKAKAFREFCNTTFEGMNYPATITPTMDENAYNNIKNRLASLQNVTPGQQLASGTRNAPGGITLVNELGPELISDNGVAYIANGGKPGFTNLNKGAIVFNAEETKDIFSHAHPNIQYQAYADGSSNGGIKQRMITGMMVPGRAFSSQTGYFPTASIAKRYPNAKRTESKASSGYTPSSNYGNNYNSYDGYTADDNVDEPVYEKVDWIAVLLDRIQRGISRLETIANSGFKSLSTRTGAATEEIAELTKEIAANQSGYKRYIREADNVGLSEDIAALVRNGTIDIREYDEETRDLISEYQEWYEKALDCKDAVEELHDEIASLYKTMFDNTQTDFENQLSLIEHRANLINSGISAANAKGYLDSAEYYRMLSEVENERILKLTEEAVGLRTKFQEAMESGEIENYSEAWYSMKNSINSVEEAIADANVKLLEYQKTMRSIRWSYFDFGMGEFGQLQEEANFLIDIMSNDHLFDEMGKFADKGTATMGLRVMNYNAYMAQADEYAKEMQKVTQEMASNPYDTELIERRKTLLGLQRQMIQAAESEKDAIKDLVSQGIQLELDALKELVSEYETSLDNAKDLYDYQKKLAEKTGDVAKLQKQLSAYGNGNDTSEENRARVQQLQEQLRKAQDDLTETEWERNIADQKKLLSDMQDQYEDYLNQRLDDLETLVKEMVSGVNVNSDKIREELNESAEQVGYTITEGLSSVMNEGTFSYYDKMFQSVSSVNTYLESINDMVAKMVGAADIGAKASTNTPSTKYMEYPEEVFTELAPTGNAQQTSSKNSSSVSDFSSIGARVGTKGYTLRVSETEAMEELKNAKYDGIIKHIGGLLGKHTAGEEEVLDMVLEEIKSKKPRVFDKLFWGYSGGGLADYTGPAMLHGSKARPELVLNATDTENFLAAAKLMRTPIMNSMMDRNLSLPELSRSMTGGDVYYNLGGIQIEHVQDYNDFVKQLRDDPKFEKLIRSVTIDPISGKSSFGAKNKIYFG